jgi:hypothetical protein
LKNKTSNLAPIEGSTACDEKRDNCSKKSQTPASKTKKTLRSLHQTLRPCLPAGRFAVKKNERSEY